MAIETEKINAEVLACGEYKHIHVKEIIIKKEDGVEISRTNNRNTYPPNTNLNSLDAEVSEIANKEWTDSIKNSYQLFLDSLEN